MKIAVAAVHDDVAGRDQVHRLVDVALGHVPGGQHQPHHARRAELADRVGQRRGRDRARRRRFLHRPWAAVEGDDLVPTLEQAARHVQPHAPQPDHCQSHE